MLNDLVVSLDIARRLKEKGWNKPTVFVWVSRPGGPSPYIDLKVNLGGYTDDFILPAPTAEEVLRELPEDLNNQGWLYVGKCHEGWRVEYGYPGCLILRLKAKSLSEAAAQMWLWCKENKYA